MMYIILITVVSLFKYIKQNVDWCFDVDYLKIHLNVYYLVFVFNKET